MTAVFCRAAADRKAETWAQQLAPFVALEFAVSDAAKGISKAVTDVAKVRRADPSAPPLEHGLDVFHTAMAAHRVLARHWRRAEAVWERAEAADARLATVKQQGLDARGVAQTARAAWARAVTSFVQVERLESAWQRIHSAPEVFGPDGRLNDRRHAEAEITAALWELTGPDWAKVRNVLTDPRCLAFLDRMHRRLESAESRPGWRAAMAWRWWLRHRRPESSDLITGMIRTVGRKASGSNYFT